MFSRRKFLAALSLTLATPSLLFGQEKRRRSRWEMITNDDPIQHPTSKPDPASWDSNTITAAWVGHSTVLINMFGTWILTDPVFSDRIGLNVANLFTIGPKRLVFPALSIEELPPIDIILLSHAHMDHLDTPSIRRFDRDIPVVMAKNTADIIEGYEFKTVYELDWGKWTEIGDVRIEALEVKHFGWRYPWEQDRSRGFKDGRSYNAYIISKNGRHILFGGDTAMHQYFKSIAERSLPIELAIMPIGAYDPWIYNHANPEQALEMTNHMGSYHIFPIHWNTFIQSEEPTAEPIARLKKVLAHQPGRLAVEAVGQTWSMDAVSIPGSWPASGGSSG